MIIAYMVLHEHWRIDVRNAPGEFFWSLALACIELACEFYWVVEMLS